MAAKRVYSEKEISTLLRRASELQRTEGPGGTGLSLSELEQIGRDVGIDPEYLKKASLELEEDQPWDGFQLLGAPTAIDLERIIEGEMTAEKWDEAVGEFRRVYGTAGETVEVGRTREWSLSDGDDQIVHVTATPVGTQTRIRVLHRLWVWAVSLHVPIMSVAVAPVAMSYSMLEFGPAVETGIALSFVAAFHGIARTIYGSIARKRDRRARKLLNDLNEVIATEATTENVVQTAALETDQSETEQERVSPAVRLEREGQRR